MKEVLNNQQIVCPGDATQFMHAIFSSDHEMMTFYLTLNRFINPASYLVERSDRQRLEDLENVLFGNVAAFEAVHHFKKISVKDVIKGYDEYAGFKCQSYAKCQYNGLFYRLYYRYY